MKETELEKVLSSWQPRPPATAIKSRLFPAPECHREFVWALRWFAPTVACAVMALAVLHQDGAYQDFSRHPKAATRLTQGESGRIDGVLINRSPDFFEWTNRSDSALNVRSFLPGTTN